MATIIYLSNDTADVSGFLKAYIGYRSPRASTTLSTAVTEATASGTAIQMTLTSGGTVAKWITVPVKEDVTIQGAVVTNFWGLESAATTNAQFGVQLAEYTTSAQSAFMASSMGTELLTAVSQNEWTFHPAAVDTNGQYTATTIDAGNRLIILPYMYNIGTMAAGRSTFDYNGLTAGADGDSYLVLTETIRQNVSQSAAGTTPDIANGPSAMAYGDYVRQLQPVIQAITGNVSTPNPQWLALADELNIQGNVGNDDHVQSA